MSRDEPSAACGLRYEHASERRAAGWFGSPSALLLALGACDVCASVETLAELSTVLDRDKFDRYLDRALRLSFVTLMRRHVHLFAVEAAAVEVVRPSCRDTKDNQFLALVLAAEADALVSSDDDLLMLHPWRGVPVMTAAEFLERGMHG